MVTIGIFISFGDALDLTIRLYSLRNWYVIRHRRYESFLGDSDEEYQMFWSFCDEKFCYEEGEIDYEKQAKTARLNKMKSSEVKS